MEVIRKITESSLEKQSKVKNALLSGKSDILKMYDGSVVFITGGSGFIGKQLVEKLVRTCNIKKIYLLLRHKKGKNGAERLNQILEDAAYDLLRSEQPDFGSKLVAVEGDVFDLNLGISEENQKKIAEEVNIIFHGAATINFGETIKIATLTNVRGTREVLNLAKTCKNLKSIVHISTAYVQSTKSRIATKIAEDFYESPFPPESLIQLAESMDNDKLDAIIKPLIEDWPNTYTFTKVVTEELVKQKSVDLPLCIVRPAIVVAAYKEPTSGWVDVKNVYGPSGLLLGLTLGVTHTMFADNNIVIDFIPVDIVNNALIAAAWETYQRYTAGEKQTKIYCVSGTRNPLRFGEVNQILSNDARPLSSAKALWYCFAIVTKYKFIYWLLTWLLHYIPGYIVDGVCMLIGEKTRLIKVYKKAYALSSVFEYFINNDWIFCDDNTLDLYNKLQDTDKEIFNFDMATVNKVEMMLSWFYGVSKFIVKDDATKFEYAAKKQWWLRIANFIVLPLLIEDWPNTYTFTKVVTEELVKQKSVDLPLCIVRPAIVVAAYKEPTSGWVDVKNVYGPSGLLLGLTLGVTHTMFADNNIVIDFIPVDIVNNALIAAAWETYQRYTAGEKQTKIYCVSGTRNPLRFGEVNQILSNDARPLSSAKALWYCFAIVTKYKFIYWLLTWLLHYIPGYIVDGVCMLIGEKTRLIKVYKKAYALSSVFEYFINNDWIFCDDNTLDLYNKLQDTDKEIFNFDMATVNKVEMMLSWFYGVSKFIVKDDATKFEYAAKKQWWLRIANFIVLPLYLYCLFKVFCLFFVYCYYFFNLFTTDYKIGTIGTKQ